MAFHSTNDHEAIRGWIEKHNGRPAVVRGMTSTLDSLSIIWQDKGAPGSRDLEEISWDEFFDAFETSNLSFRYLEHAEHGNEDSSFNFLDRESVPGLDNGDFILPEENEMARENMFGSAPAADSGDENAEAE